MVLFINCGVLYPLISGDTVGFEGVEMEVERVEQERRSLVDE